MMQGLDPHQPPEISSLLSLYKYFPFIIISAMGVLHGWYWSVVIGLHHQVPDHLKPNLKLFKFFFFVPLVYLLIISIGLFSVFSSMDSWNAEIIQPEPSWFIGLILIIPLHLLSIFSIFYQMVVAAKTIRFAEVKEFLSTSEYIGDFFLIWFFPIGVWFLQPKINKLAEEKNEEGEGLFLK